MAQTISTSDIVIEIPLHLILKIYADTVKRVSTQTGEPATFEIEGIISIPNVIQVLAVGYEIPEYHSTEEAGMYRIPNPLATLTLKLYRVFPDL